MYCKHQPVLTRFPSREKEFACNFVIPGVIDKRGRCALPSHNSSTWKWKYSSHFVTIFHQTNTVINKVMIWKKQFLSDVLIKLLGISRENTNDSPRKQGIRHDIFIKDKRKSHQQTMQAKQYKFCYNCHPKWLGQASQIILCYKWNTKFSISCKHSKMLVIEPRSGLVFLFTESLHRKHQT